MQVASVKLKGLVERLGAVSDIRREMEAPGFVAQKHRNARPARGVAGKARQAGPLLRARPLPLFFLGDVRRVDDPGQVGCDAAPGCGANCVLTPASLRSFKPWTARSYDPGSLRNPSCVAASAPSSDMLTRWNPVFAIRPSTST